MTSKRLYFLLIAVLTLLSLAVVASVYYGNSLLKDRAAKLTSLKVESKTLEEQQTSLVQAKKDVQKYSELESIAKTVVPQEKDQARTVREIIALANASGIQIANIAFPSSSLGEKKKAAPATGDTGATTQTPTQTTSQSQVEAVKGIAGLYQMDINVQGSGKAVSYESFLRFLERLEQNRRTAQVINLSVQPSSTNRNQVTFSLILRVYIKP